MIHNKCRHDSYENLIVELDDKQSQKDTMHEMISVKDGEEIDKGSIGAELEVLTVASQTRSHE